LGSLLTYRQRACLVLGARTPQAALLNAASVTGASAVVVVSHLPTHRRVAVDVIRALSEAGRPTFYAGNAFLFDWSRDDLPGTYLGESLTKAADLIDATLTAVHG